MRPTPAPALQGCYATGSGSAPFGRGSRLLARRRVLLEICDNREGVSSVPPLPLSPTGRLREANPLGGAFVCCVRICTQGGSDAPYTFKSRGLVRCRCTGWSSAAGLLPIRLSPIHQTIHTYSSAGRRYSTALADSNPANRFSPFRDMDRKCKERQHRDASNHPPSAILSGWRCLRNL